MNKRPLLWRFFFGVAATLLVGLTSLCSDAMAAAHKAVVLPFHVEAGAELPNASTAVPQSILDQLKAQGFDVLPLDEARGIFNSMGKSSIDLATAKSVGQKAQADIVIYGMFNQEGKGFILNTRIVPVKAGSPVPAKYARSSMSGLNDASSQLASKAASVLRSVELVPASAPRPTSAAEQLVPMNMPTSGGLADVQVRGIHNMDPDVVLMRLTIRKGDRPNASAINEEVKRIWAMGFFTDVQARMEGNVLVFQVVEKPRIDHLVIEGADKVDQEDVLAAMSTRTGTVLNEQTIATDMEKITELYNKEGYYLAKPTYSVSSKGDGKGAILTVHIKEGKKLYITEVRLDGLKNLEKSDIENYMAMRERGIFSWITGTGIMKEENIERDTNAITAYGLNEGYIDIQVGTPDIQYQDDGIHVIFSINEGERYNIKDIVFAGDVIDTEDNMNKVIELDNWKKEKQYFSVSVMQEDVKRLQNYYNDIGYANAEVETRLVKDEGSGSEKNVNVIFVINKKRKVFIRRLLVEGNERTRDNVILREMRLGDGDPYEGYKLRRSTERLNRLRYFKAIDTELIPTGKEDEVDLKIKVKEDNTGALTAGIGYSTYFDVGVSASIMERNLFGRGYQISLSGFFSWRRTSGTLSFTNPRLYDTDISFGNDLYYVRDYWDDFTKDTLGDTIRFGYPIGEYTSIGLSYRLERYEIYDVSSDASPYITDYKGINWTSAISARITRDTTDSKDRPTKGTITRLWTEWGGGGLGGTDNFVKVMADWQGFYTWRENHTLHARGRVGAIFKNTDERIPVFERFYVGGMDTVRGYSYSDASPRSKDPHYKNDIIGGDRMGIANFEYVWTFQKKLGLAIVPFFDIAYNIDSGHQNLAFDFDEYWVYSTGLEFRWKSPMGDIRIAYGIPLKRDFDHEMEQGRLEFTMGQFF